MNEQPMHDEGKALFMAQQVLEAQDRYPLQLVQAALMLLLDSESVDMQAIFMELHQNISTVQALAVGRGLCFPPSEEEYYQAHELNQLGIEIGVEPLHGWIVRLFSDQLRRHCIVVGMTGSGKTNLLKLIAVGIAELETKRMKP